MLELAAAFPTTARTRTSALSLFLSLSRTTAATALPRSIALALSVRAAAAALTRTTLPAESRALTLLALPGLAVCLSSRTMAAMALTVSIRIAIGIEPAATAARTEREVRRLALGNLSFGSRQLRADQWAMNGPVVAFISVGRAPIHRVGFNHGLDRRLRRRGHFDLLF